MKSKSEAYTNCVKSISMAYQDLALAQSDCKMRVDAELDLLARENLMLLSPDDKSSIKKIAKAVASGKADAIKRESASLAQIVADFFNEPILLNYPRETDEQ